MYINYTEYKELGGTLTESAFNSLIYEAQVKLDYHTFNRLKRDNVVTEAVKCCLVKLLQLLNTYNEYVKLVSDVNNPIISSSSNDGVSISFGGYLGNTTPNDVSQLADKLDKDIKSTIQQYLQGEKNQKGQVLLYRGVYR